MTYDAGALWILVTVLGPLLLMGAMAYANQRWRNRTLIQQVRADRGTRHLYREGAEDTQAPSRESNRAERLRDPHHQPKPSPVR